MKAFFTLAAIALLANSCFSQNGTIIGFSINPTNPTPTDDIEIYVDLSFFSGGCELDNSNFGINGDIIVANAHHCVGLLAVICPNTDTFQIGQLPVGTYTFDFTLTSGAGFPSCSPGIVPDDNDQFQFTVSSTVGVNEVDRNTQILYPNPVNETLNLTVPTSSQTEVIDLTGKRVLSIPYGTKSIDVSSLAPGVYYLKSEGRSLRFLKEN